MTRFNWDTWDDFGEDPVRIDEICGRRTIEIEKRHSGKKVRYRRNAER